MAEGYDKNDWTVRLSFGVRGSVRYGNLHGGIEGTSPGDTFQIMWKAPRWPVGADIKRLDQAAKEAVKDALKRRTDAGESAS
jgi:hypothetical protein